MAWRGFVAATATATLAAGLLATTLAATAGASTNPGTVAHVTPGTKVTGVTAPRSGAAATGSYTAGSSSSTTATSGVKAAVSGLVDRHRAPTTAYAKAVRSFVVDTTWSSLQPVQNGPIVHPNAIDEAIAAAKAGNYTLKLRVRAGIDAPTWAKSLDGAPLPFYYTSATAGLTGQLAGTVGRFWLPDFGAAYDNLQVRLAAAYDDVPQIRETDITRCSTIFAETYLRDSMDKRNVQTLLHAGFTVAQDDTCHDEQIQAAKVWVHTDSDLSFNPYSQIQSNGTVRTDLAYTESQMVYCRSVLGARCVLANHSLATKREAGGNYGDMYAYMHKLGGAIDFQTATSTKMGDYTQVLAYAASLGARSVELPTGYTSWPEPTLAAYALKMSDS